MTLQITVTKDSGEVVFDNTYNDFEEPTLKNGTFSKTKDNRNLKKIKDYFKNVRSAYPEGKLKAVFTNV